ncbi:LOW QUALITY PROTEIN: hypothetical protein PHMEG_00035950 [Phytophthora megakarya]|uniref:C3H1-type domain-containing protein n=1 Tax=Phytophthora megakarya TaxID=4795 RepID=A0A225UP74_9STRA|nr:LOW QUALITY PROTEIN: hypothetical protein PHMEG_00035950 [Phytophthora megakarya]
MPPKVCFNFQRSGKCRFGDSCKFAHGHNDVSQKENKSFSRENSGGRRSDVKSAPTLPFSLEGLQTQLGEKLKTSTIFSGHSDALVCFWPGQDRLEVLWKGFLTPQDPDNVWRVNSQTQALNFINAGLHALLKDNLAPQFSWGRLMDVAFS